jgi:predicted transglutaminase-like cysteine proteinase
MHIIQAVNQVGRQFQYLKDKNFIIDPWFVMPTSSDGKLRGDCDDFALTCIWLACDRNVAKFIWRVLVTHQYRIYMARTADGENHAVGYADGFWFDNWTLEALPKQQFFQKTGHRIRWLHINLAVMIRMLAGSFFRKRANK